MSDSRTRRRERRPTQSEEEQEQERSNDEELVCPECGGNLVVDEARGETVCEDCGLVVDEDEIDRGPEWRA
ncbi:TFIIB-type zinc ribbon-containing protein, partial [Halarchaeum acidiphilum]|uniref:TFIIB-type zinc ribbon-containing protein n=1 Tax=Halarchaeum acidiphilum TaxID=489138 RepID=UPI002D21E357